MKWFKTKISHDERTGLWAVVLIAAILALQYAGGWYGLELARISKEGELERHLADLGRLAPLTLREPALALGDLALDASWTALRQRPGAVKSGDDDDVSPDPAAYRQGLDAAKTEPLRRFAAESRLARIVVLNDNGLILADTAEPDRILTPFDYWAVDAAQIARARAGSPAASPAYTTGDAAYKRYYQPVSDAGTPARVILCLVAGRAYLGELDRLADRLWRINLTLTLLMAGVAAVIARLLIRQRRIARQAAEADRLAGLGALAAGFAHELRNPLEIVRAFTEDLERSLNQDGARALSEARESCRDIIEEVDRMNRLVGQFLSYSRSAPEGGASAAGGARASLTAAVRQVLTMLAPQAQKREVRLTLEAPPTAGPADGTANKAECAVAIDDGALKQILINLLLNAIQASPADGEVRLALAAAGRQVELQIADQGPGVAERDRRRIFEPFFTLRPGGSGLGLAVSRQLATGAGGSLELAETRAGGANKKNQEGARFILRLPRAAAPAKPPRAGALQE